jgi:hypothetical protein
LLSLNIITSIQNIISCFVDFLEDTWVWSASLNGQYTLKSGYIWLLSQHYNKISQESLSWIWKLYGKHTTSLSLLEVSYVIEESF